MPVIRKLIVSAVFLIEALIVYFLVAQRYPISADDYSYLYQAKLFAHGKLWAEDDLYNPSLPFYDCLETFCLRDDQGHRFSKYAPGWPAILAAGTKLHVPWLVDPLLGSILVFLMLDYAHRRLGKEQAKIVALLVTLCFFLCYYAASARAHIATALFVFAAFLFYDLAKARPDYAKHWLFAAGALLGCSSLIRYVDWIPLAIWIGISLLREKRLADIIVFVTGFILVASGNLLYDAVLSGNPLKVPSAIHRTSLISDRLVISPIGFSKTAVRLESLLWVFPPAILLLIFSRWWRRSANAKMFVALLLMIIATYFFYPASAGGPGPRYLLAYFPFLILTTAYLLQQLHSNSPTIGRRIQLLSVIGLFFGNLVFVANETYTMYWRRDLQRTTAHIAAGKNIFLLKTGTYKTVVGDLTRNPPALSSADNLYFAWCTKPERDALLSRFPGYQVFVYEYPGHLTKFSENL
jgi:hypothetical protein